ncbi:MAG: HEPN domain-containing protein [Armatimonadota bacterium]
MNEKAQYWVEVAEYDLETAKVMLDHRRFLYVGFMCHQVIEKMLKACYANSHSELPPHTHNLKYLAQKSGMDALMSEDQKNTLNLLQPLNIEARYPEDKDGLLQALSEERCAYILQKTEELYQWIKLRL